METQPPPDEDPAVALLDTTRTALLLNVLLTRVTEAAATELTAPPHEEHGEAFKQVAVLFSNEDDAMRSVPEVTAIAPPVTAVLLKKLQLETSTVLPSEHTAPPPELEAFAFRQF